MKGGFFITKRQFPSDKELLERIYSGDDSALNILLEKYRWFSYKLVSEYLKSNPENEYLKDELHALVFYDTYRLIQSFKSEKGYFFPYWKKVASRNITRYVQKNNSYITTMSLDYVPKNNERQLHESVGIEESFYTQETLSKAFLKIINNPDYEFTEKEKNIISYYLKGYDFKEIANITKYPLPTVYRVYNQAVEKIGSVLKGLFK